MSEIPDFLKARKGAPRGTEMAPASMDKPPALRELTPLKPQMTDNLILNAELITPDDVKRISAEALERVTWRLKSTPYGVQAYALNLCGKRFGFGYFLEQGLGKTRLALADFWNRFEAGLNDCMVIITINSMKLTWALEMEEEGYPFDVHIWPEVKNFPENAKGQVVVMNFDAIRGKGLDWLRTWIKRHKAFLVIDESTCIANHNSKQGKKGFELATECSATRAMAGLPNPNGPHDFFNQLRAIRVPVGMVPKAFRNRYCKVGGYRNNMIIGTQNEAELAGKMAGRVFFADKDTWAPTLPKRLFTERVVQMTPAQKMAYKTMANELYAEVEKGVISIEQALSKSTKLQQIAGGYLLNQEEVHTIGNGEDPKMDAVAEYLEFTPGKQIIFAHYRHSVDKLIARFPGFAFALAKARMTDQELRLQVQRFNEDPECEGFIAPISVMQYGHTLVGSPTHPCTGSVYYENTYSRIGRSQSQDRNHRWGASEEEGATVVYCDIICSPIDRAIIRRLQTKGEMATTLLTALKEVIHGV